MLAGWIQLIQDRYGWEPGDLYDGLGEPPDPANEHVFRERQRARTAQIVKLIEGARGTIDDATAIGIVDRLCWYFVDGRRKQFWPETDPTILMLAGGRRSGKTLPAARTIGEWAQDHPKSRWAAIGPTFAQCRAVMFEGETGLLKSNPVSGLWGGSIDKAYNKSDLQLKFANGAIVRGYTSERPGSIRGQEFWGLWIDEPCELKDANRLPMEPDTTFSNAQLTLSGGKSVGWSPKTIVTGTPKPVKLLAGDRDGHPGLMNGWGADIGVELVRMSSRENIYNLPESFKRAMASLDGKRIGRQEIEAELLTDVEGAMWVDAWIHVDREPPTTGWVGHAVGLDHAVTSHEGSDETGIVVAGLHSDSGYWVLEDLSGRFSPRQWATIIRDVTDRYPGIFVITEPNQGGDLIEMTLKQEAIRAPQIVTDRAFTSKVARFTPVQELYEPSSAFPLGRVRHAARFPELTNQMCEFTGSPADSDDRIDALAAAIRYLSKKDDHSIGSVDLSALSRRRATWH